MQSTLTKTYVDFPGPDYVASPSKQFSCDPNTLITVDEPTAMFWDDNYCNAGHPHLMRFVPDFPAGNDIVSGYDMYGGDSVDGVWIPPNQAGMFWADYWFKGDTGTYGPGLHPYLDERGNPSFDHIAAKVYPGIRIRGSPGVNEMDSWQFKRYKPWRDHLYDCCSGKINDKQLCGNFNTGSDKQWDTDHCASGKLDFLSTCSADDIMDSGKPICNKLCKLEPKRCEWIKKKHCALNPNDERCACMLRAADSEFQAKKQMLLKHGYNLPDMCTNEVCSVSNDLSNAFLTNDDILTQSKLNCADTKYDIKITDISGDSNIVNVVQGDGGDSNDGNSSNGSSNGSSGSNVGSNSNNNTSGYSNTVVQFAKSYWWLILIFIVIILGGIEIMLGMQSDKKVNKTSSESNESNVGK